MVSSTFVIWNGNGAGRKGRFVQNFHLQSMQWKKQQTKMETKEEFASLLMERDRLLSFDIRTGYRKF